jgi:hypothetical protein
MQMSIEVMIIIIKRKIIEYKEGLIILHFQICQMEDHIILLKLCKK